MQQLLKDLENTQQSLLPYFDLPETDLNKTYAPGKWTIKELLNHIVDAETVFYDRVRRVIATDKSVIWGFNQDAWCKELNYKTFPLAVNKQVFLSIRAAVIYTATQHYVDKSDRPFVHSETGLRTLKDEFDKIAWHCQHHLDQIELALGKIV